MDLNNRPGGPNLIVTAKTAHKVHFLDAATLAMAATIDMPGSTHELTLSPDNRYVVVSSNQDAHAAIYLADGLKQIASFPIKKSPMGFGFAPGGTHGYLSRHDDAEVFEFELASGRVTRTFATAAGCEFIIAYEMR